MTMAKSPKKGKKKEAVPIQVGGGSLKSATCHDVGTDQLESRANFNDMPDISVGETDSLERDSMNSDMEDNSEIERESRRSKRREASRANLAEERRNILYGSSSSSSSSSSEPEQR